MANKGRPYYLMSSERGGYVHGPFTLKEARKHVAWHNKNSFDGEPTMVILDHMPSVWEIVFNDYRTTK